MSASSTPSIGSDHAAEACIGNGQHYFQKTIKYPATTFGMLKKNFAAASADARLTEFLSDTGCLEHLAE